MRPILAGIDAEYGLLVEGRGAEDQIEDSMALVQDYPGECFLGWDYRFESPRADLRGFQLKHLAYDPEDAKFDAGKSYRPAQEVRADHVLPNGARFYNDHGHPEYATPECLSIFELARHDCAGQLVVARSARVMAERLECDVRAYKNNTDFHGASYGTHEGYLVPRSIGFERLFAATVPMLIARQVLTGAGKVGGENGRNATYQLSQRADFFVEPANAETLYRRPIFNTRDEPHADAERWVRLHVISGDSNMIASGTARKVGLLKLALHLAEVEAAPVWKIPDPVRAFQEVSRDEAYAFRIDLDGRSWTTAYEILESYFSAAERHLELDDELRWTIDTSRQLLEDLKSNFDAFRRQVDWAAKRHILDGFIAESGGSWRDPSLRSYDLEYHNADSEESLHAALIEMGEVEPDPASEELEARLRGNFEATRARARGIAVRRFRSSLVSASWRALVFSIDGENVEVELAPDREYPAQLEDATDVGTFITMLRGTP